MWSWHEDYLTHGRSSPRLASQLSRYMWSPCLFGHYRWPLCQLSTLWLTERHICWLECHPNPAMWKFYPVKTCCYWICLPSKDFQLYGSWSSFINGILILLTGLQLSLQAIVDVLSNTLEETNLNGWKDLQEVCLTRVMQMDHLHLVLTMTSLIYKPYIINWSSCILSTVVLSVIHAFLSAG